jgi:O-Antigen ligase/Tetratricopeptide repeat
VTTSRTSARLRPALALGGTSAAIFAATCVSGAWLAFDGSAARREFALIATGLALSACLALAVRAHLRSTLWWTGVGCGVGSIAVGGAWVASGFPDGGATAGALCILIPLSACGLSIREHRRVPLATMTGLSVGIATLVLVATGESSAVVGLAVGALVSAWATWRAYRDGRSPATRLVDAVVAAGLVAAGGLYFSVMFAASPSLVPDATLGAHVVGRRDLWQDAMAMIGDYRVTGTGLAGSAMVMSTYASLQHVPFHPHVHHIFLQVALQQGIPGVVGLIGMFLGAGWVLIALAHSGDRGVRLLAVPVAASLASLAAWGLLEADLYGSAWLPLLLLPFGVTFGVGLGILGERRAPRSAASRTSLLVIVAPLAVIVVTLLWGGRAQWQASLGASVQTRAELGTYRWPEWPVQDQLRREHAVDLEPALQRYQAAIALDPANVTALRRLGQIDLSRGDTDRALGLLESAAAMAPRDRAARRLLAEVHALTGNPAMAAELWRVIGTTREELEPRLWWYRHAGSAHDAAEFEAAVRALEQNRSAMMPR